MILEEILVLVVLHWICDYLLQTREMGDNKSSSWYYLLQHTLVYSVFIYIGLLLYGLEDNSALGQFMTLTFLLHTATDYFTSRAVKRLYAQKRMYETFAVMGFDQALHHAQLFICYDLLL